MASTNKTTHYDLSQYVGSDKPTYLGDYNTDMSKIDTAINSAQTKADSADVSATTAQTTAESAQTTANTAVTNAAAAQTTANSALSNIGTLANLTTSDKTSAVNAINEVDGEIGNLGGLATDVKTDLVNAINSIETKVEELDNYSTTESDTGKKWIDNRTIYRKVIDIGYLVNNTTKSVNHGISNVRDFVEIYLMCKTSSGYYYTANIYGTSGIFDGKHVAVRANDTQLQIGCDGDSSTNTAIAILEYTKNA